jgi:hypothetical protein
VAVDVRGVGVVVPAGVGVGVDVGVGVGVGRAVAVGVGIGLTLPWVLPRSARVATSLACSAWDDASFGRSLISAGTQDTGEDQGGETSRNQDQHRGLNGTQPPAFWPRLRTSPIRCVSLAQSDYCQAPGNSGAEHPRPGSQLATAA